MVKVCGDRTLKQGQGWRLGWNTSAAAFQGLVGGEDWAMELTEAELRDFCCLVQQLAETMAGMAAHLMEEERIACEAETDLLWLEAEGYPVAYSLRFILNQGRRGEGFWPPEVTTELVQACQTLRVQGF